MNLIWVLTCSFAIWYINQLGRQEPSSSGERLHSYTFANTGTTLTVLSPSKYRSNILHCHRVFVNTHKEKRDTPT